MVKNSTYRLTGYAMPDGSEEIVYNAGPAPVGGVLKWDEMVTETVTSVPVSEIPPVEPPPSVL